jgi:hypothetical protein
LKTAFVLLFLTGCSTLIPVPGTEDLYVDCEHIRVCPVEEIQRGLQVFAEDPEFSGFDPAAPLIVHVFPDGYVLEKRPCSYDEIRDCVVIGETQSPNEVTIGGLAPFPHELGHVHLWRETGDGDTNHEGPGGPWTYETTKAVQRVRAALGW